MKKLVILAALTATATPAAAQISQKLGTETTIPIACAGSLRAYIVDEADGSNRYPGRVCGIDTIVNAAPLSGTPGADRKK